MEHGDSQPLKIVPSFDTFDDSMDKIGQALGESDGVADGHCSLIVSSSFVSQLLWLLQFLCCSCSINVGIFLLTIQS